MRTHYFSSIAALVLGGLLACTNLTNAQDAKGGNRRQLSPQQRVEQLDNQLKLTADQKTKLTALFDEQGKKLRELRADKTLSQEDRRTKVRAINEADNKQIKDILTPEQNEKYQKLHADQKGKGGGKKKAQ
jgi:periplasmic protein CpxP/Spy